MKKLFLLSLSPVFISCGDKGDEDYEDTGSTEELYCTDMGCSGSYEITLDTTGLSQGLYTVEWVFSGTSGESCDFEIPWSEDPEGCSSSAAITGTEGSISIVRYMNMGEVYDSVTIELTDSSSNSLFSGSHEPEWSVYYPNGEECDRDSGCHGAQFNIEIQ